MYIQHFPTWMLLSELIPALDCKPYLRRLWIVESSAPLCFLSVNIICAVAYVSSYDRLDVNVVSPSKS